MAWSRTPWSAKNGLGFGLLAGVVFAVAECLTSWLAGEGLLRPVRYAASEVLGVHALTEPARPLILAVGLVLHFAFSAFLGLAYSLIDARLSPELRPSVAHQAAVGMLFGIGVWVVTFQFMGRGYFPWFLELPQFPQLVLHAVFFGAPLGLLFAAAERRRVAIAAFERQESTSGGGSS
jgi:succinate dehydrogenase/fumarate reductase cytochrome b subunit